MTTPARASENARQAVAGLEAVAGFARALTEGDRPPGARPVPGQARERVARTVCALRHLADQFPGLSFETMLDAAGEQYRQPGAGQARAAGAAAVACERALSVPGQLAGGSWPPGTRDYLQAHATRQGQRPQEAVAFLGAGLLAGLRDYADAQGTSFREALAAGMAAHARQRLLAESPFRTGQDPAPTPQATVPFPPCATHQGVVVAAADAEWLLVRTAARNYASGLIPARARSYASEFAGLPPDPRDVDDERALNRALADARGLHPNQVFADVAPGIAARIMQLTDGPGKAAELGREHGRSGTPPYCDIRTEGEAAALMGALGETEPMTDANRQYRALLVTEYAGAYRDAAARRPPPADSPARIAARDHPRAGQPPAPPAATDPPGRGGPPAPPRHGPRLGA
jgi:hypothetical protein